MDCGHGAKLVIDAGPLPKLGGQAVVHAERFPCEGAQRAGNARALQRVQPAGGEARGLAADALPLDDGRLHPGFRQVVGHGTPGSPASDDRHVGRASCHLFRL